MKLHTGIEQNSVDWQILRSRKITASEIDALVSPNGKVRDSEGVETYLNQKLCEMWTGGPLLSLQGIFDVEQGKLLEERAKPAFTLHTGIEIENVAFIETEDGRAGCSPDGCVFSAARALEAGCEIKCPRMDTHVGYLRAGKLPKAYVAQVQFSMHVTGCARWHFFSYHRALPPLHLVVERDEDFQAAIAEALEQFVPRLDEAMAHLVELNGGLPRALRPLTPLVGRESKPFVSLLPS
jgi:hypothetical protein